eukprot:TRINITY_DN1_c0_g1_i10.p3 TRINITY_DN1_c0_g1~~TRINITY_DN1_c0_g1_i10.p3  ORF type:complete len:125 (+),score=10.40 TRINITY_DN1_c0_g1_i10:1085-1459(+)
MERSAPQVAKPTFDSTLDSSLVTLDSALLLLFARINNHFSGVHSTLKQLTKSIVHPQHSVLSHGNRSILLNESTPLDPIVRYRSIGSCTTVFIPLGCFGLVEVTRILKVHQHQCVLHRRSSRNR